MTWHGWHIGWMVAWELIGLAAALSLFWALLGGPNRRRRIGGEMGDPTDVRAASTSAHVSPQ